MSQDFVQFVGAVVVAAVTVQVLLMLATTVRRYAADNEANRLSLQVLRLRADAALANHRWANDTAEFGWNGIRKFEIDRKVPEIDGVHSFYLLPHDGKKLPPFLAGQFLTFELNIPGEMKSVIRCSLPSGSPKKGAAALFQPIYCAEPMAGPRTSASVACESMARVTCSFSVRSWILVIRHGLSEVTSRPRPSWVRCAGSFGPQAPACWCSSLPWLRLS